MDFTICYWKKCGNSWIFLTQMGMSPSTYGDFTRKQKKKKRYFTRKSWDFSRKTLGLYWQSLAYAKLGINSKQTLGFH